MQLQVHSFIIGDVEDPEIYAAEPIIAFEQSNKGQWLHEHSYKQMAFNIVADPSIYGYRVIVSAWLRDTDLTYYRLKWC